MTKFNYDDMVRIASNAQKKYRPGALAWVVGVFAQRPGGEHFSIFPAGVIYTIEYEDGEAMDVHEADLEAWR